MDFLLICLVSWLSAGHLGNSVSSGRFSSAYCGGLDVELRALGSLQLQAGSNRSAAWEKPALWMGWFTTRVFSCVCVCVCVCVCSHHKVDNKVRERVNVRGGRRRSECSLISSLSPGASWPHVKTRHKKTPNNNNKEGSEGQRGVRVHVRDKDWEKLGQQSVNICSIRLPARTQAR